MNSTVYMFKSIPTEGSLLPQLQKCFEMEVGPQKVECWAHASPANQTVSSRRGQRERQKSSPKDLWTFGYLFFYFSVLNINLSTILSYCRIFYFPCQEWVGGGGVIFFFWPRGWGVFKTFCIMWGNLKKIFPLKKCPLQPPPPPPCSIHRECKLNR